MPLSDELTGGMSSSNGRFVDLTDEPQTSEVRGAKGEATWESVGILESLKAALKVKRRERKEAERVLTVLLEEEEDLETSIRELEDQEDSKRRKLNQPDWGKTAFEWDDKVRQLLKNTFKLPEFRPLQREVVPLTSPPLPSLPFSSETIR
jgi:chromosome segregation ATPase